MQSKLMALLKSRKFWFLLMSIATLLNALMTQKITDYQFLQGLIVAGSAYMLGTGIEASGERNK